MKHEEPLLKEYFLFLIFHMNKHLIFVGILLKTVCLKGEGLVCILIVILKGFVKSGCLINSTQENWIN
jgi:hypothetical protein